VSYYLHAFCLDEGKAQPGHEELVVGPFEWVNITWDFLRAGNDDGDADDHQFYRDTSGFWYPVANVGTEGEIWRSMQPDYENGRFSDIAILRKPPTDLRVRPNAARTVIDPVERDRLARAVASEMNWLVQPYDG